ncbi:MAG: glycosyltransferase family 39 protein [Tenericutes bacterium]|nr:glycosyltransferase family 39 protein [Mycoplasmatota bacterium]
MKNLVNKMFNFVNKFLLIFTIICFSISLIGAIFFYTNRSYDYLNPLVLIVGSIVYLLLLIKLYKVIIKLDDKKKKIIVGILLGLQFILLLISAFVISSIPQVDLIHILTEINSLNDTGSILNSVYYSVYPNNRFLLIILYGLQKIIPIGNQILFSLLSTICISVMSLFTYKTVNKVWDLNKGLLSLFICVLSPIFYLYVSYYYTDVLMLPFASILIYLIVKTKDEKNLKSNVLYGLLIGIIAIIGYKIRAVAIFILVAYFVYLIFTKKILIVLKKFAPIIIGAILTITCISTIENKFFTNVNVDKEFPMTHWIMMGVNEKSYGYYSQDDYNLSSSASNVSERTDLNIKEIKNRLSDLGPFGTVKLLVVKLVSVWGKGDYSYQKYLELVNDFNPSYSYLLEDKNIVINYLLQFSKIVVMFMAIISLINIYKSGKKSIIAISLFGAVFFYLVWEVCPRYGLSFLPWLILIGTCSYDTLNTNYEKFKFYKYFKCIILVLTLALFAFSFNKYTGISYKENIVAKDSVTNVKYISLNKEAVITQTLDLYDSFNKIRLKFKVNEIDDATYKLELITKNEVVYEKDFKKNDLKDKKYTDFYLDKTYEGGSYTVRLSSDSTSDLEVYIAYKEKFDYYPNGILEVNKKEETGDLMFEVVNNEERGIYTYLEYMTIMILTLGMEVIVLFRKKEEVNEEK